MVVHWPLAQWVLGGAHGGTPPSSYCKQSRLPAKRPRQRPSNHRGTSLLHLPPVLTMCTNTRLSRVAMSCHRCILCVILLVCSVPHRGIGLIPATPGGTKAPSRLPLIPDTSPVPGTLTADQGTGWSTARPAALVTSWVRPQRCSG